MTSITARKIGQALSLQWSIIGLCLAYLLFGLLIFDKQAGVLSNLFWISKVDFKIHLLVGITGVLVIACLLGRAAGLEILVKRKNYLLTGAKYSLLTLLGGTLLGSTLGFLQEGIHNIGTPDTPFYDYYFKPFYWVMGFGSIPALLIGFLFGYQIKRKT